jgi:hypothetical protein
MVTDLDGIGGTPRTAGTRVGGHLLGQLSTRQWGRTLAHKVSCRVENSAGDCSAVRVKSKMIAVQNGVELTETGVYSNTRGMALSNSLGRG